MSHHNHTLRTKTYQKIGLTNRRVWASFLSNRCRSGTSVDPATIVNMAVENIISDLLSKYEFIEGIEGVNRSTNKGMHKSNIFSIKITDSQLNEAITNLDERKQVQRSINNVIKDIIKKISPANTQLWKIEWVGM